MCSVNPVGLVIQIVVFALLTLHCHAANCDASSFGVLATSPTVGYCMRDSNVSILALPAPPTEEQLAKICETPMCRQMLKILLALNPVECEIPLGSRIKLRGDLMDPAVTYCASHEHGVATESAPALNVSGTIQSDRSNQSPVMRSGSSGVRPRGMITVYLVGLVILSLV